MSGSRNISRIWRTADFAPAPPGWRIVSLWPGRRETLPMPGWLIQDEAWYDLNADELVDPSPGRNQPLDRRVIPGMCVEGYGWAVEAVDVGGASEIWCVLAPGQPDPTEEEEAAERARRSQQGSVS